MEGIVKWYNEMKSYGFIKTSDGNDVFVHRSALPSGTTLREGDIVEFEVQETEKGQQAINIKKV